jgi:hypothetical protein
VGVAALTLRLACLSLKMIFMILVEALITAVVKTHQVFTKRQSLRLPPKPCQAVKSLTLACGLERKRFLLLPPRLSSNAGRMKPLPLLEAPIFLKARQTLQVTRLKLSILL